MDKLELKHLAPYLPYGLTYQSESWGKKYVNTIETLGPIKHKIGNPLGVNDFVPLSDVKPILRVMSDLDDLTKYKGDSYSFLSEMNLNLPRYVDRDLDFEIDHNGSYMTYVNCEDAFKVYDFLFANHFDVFGLIDKGLAIDINTIESEASGD